MIKIYSLTIVIVILVANYISPILVIAYTVHEISVDEMNIADSEIELGDQEIEKEDLQEENESVTKDQEIKVDIEDQEKEKGLEKVKEEEETKQREEPDLSNQIIVDVGSFDDLQDAITFASINGVLTAINVTSNFSFNSSISIDGGRNITIQSNGDYILTQQNGRHFMIESDSSLTLGEGVTLNGDSQIENNPIIGGVHVANGGTFTMAGGTIRENSVTLTRNRSSFIGSGVHVASGGTFTMAGGTIRENSVIGIDIDTEGSSIGGSYGGGGVRSSGTFIMTGGTIIGNRVVQGRGFSGFKGGGVQVAGGTFTMTGGTIRENSAPSGGGVQVTDGTFTMTGGTIRENSATSGGGVQVTDGTFTMTGGTIRENSATINGGGVHLNYGLILGNNVIRLGDFEMEGGVITHNTAVLNGGGVYILSSIIGDSPPLTLEDRINIKGGAIRQNTAGLSGGGIFTSFLGQVMLRSDVEFSGNTAQSSFAPPFNVERAFPSIEAGPISIHNHPVNNYDMGFNLPSVSMLSITKNLDDGGEVKLEDEINLSQVEIFRGTDILIEAVPSDGYQFIGWTSSNGGTFVDDTHASTLFTMPNADTTITANFEQVYNLTLQANPINGGNPSSEKTAAAQGETTILTANPNEGFQFMEWIVEGAGSSVENKTEEETTFTMGTEDAIVTAVYEEIKWEGIRFLDVPEVLEFENTTIQNQMTAIHRQDPNWSLSIEDTRSEGDPWSLMVSADPLRSMDGHEIDDALVFKRGDKIHFLSQGSAFVYEEKTVGKGIIPISWNPYEGLLLHMRPSEARATTYTTTISWTLQSGHPNVLEGE